MLVGYQSAGIGGLGPGGHCRHRSGGGFQRSLRTGGCLLRGSALGRAFDAIVCGKGDLSHVPGSNVPCRDALTLVFKPVCSRSRNFSNEMCPFSSADGFYRLNSLLAVHCAVRRPVVCVSYNDDTLPTVLFQRITVQHSPARVRVCVFVYWWVSVSGERGRAGRVVFVLFPVAPRLRRIGPLAGRGALTGRPAGRVAP